MKEINGSWPPYNWFTWFFHFTNLMTPKVKNPTIFILWEESVLGRILEGKGIKCVCYLYCGVPAFLTLHSREGVGNIWSPRGSQECSLHPEVLLCHFLLSESCFINFIWWYLLFMTCFSMSCKTILNPLFKQFPWVWTTFSLFGTSVDSWSTPPMC